MVETIKPKIEVPGSGYLLAQSALLIVNYGFSPLPWWVTWFPSLLLGGILAVVILVLVIGLIVAWVVD